MAVEQFDIGAWFSRIGYNGSREPTLGNLRLLVTAHATSIAYESTDVLLNKPPSLDPKVLQSKMIVGGRGGYCFEQNMLFRAGLLSLGYKVASLQVRVVRGFEIDTPRPMLHMVLRVDLPEGAFLADVGFGNLAPTTALKLLVDEEQETPHEIMRFVAMGDELVLQSRLGNNWEHIYRVVFLPRVDAEYAICNWFTATHPKSPHLNNLIAARPGPDRTRLTLYNSRLSIRYPSGEVDRRTISGSQAFRDVLTKDFGIRLSDFDLQTAVANMEQRGTSGAPHPSFA
jgi:N-hydroxyarylamine O-acetyltransferase